MNGIATRRPVITLITDFGLDDTYVGTMKGVILGIAPEAQVVDLTHAVPPQDIRQAAFHLSTVIRYFPSGTVHTVVVDPGVGSERRAIAVQTARAFYVAPDNGVLTLALERDPPQRVIKLSNANYWLPQVGTTFHGRDIFAPVAAYLARGIPIADLGSPIADMLMIPVSRPIQRPDGAIEGHVQHVDRFGNGITDIPVDLLPPGVPLTVEAAGHPIGDLQPTYSAVEPGEPLAVIGSAGYVEVAVREGNAAQELGIELGTCVIVRPN